MKSFLYAILGFVVFWAAYIISVLMGNAMGPGPYETGFIVAAICVLCATAAVCTGIIVDAIKKKEVETHPTTSA